MKRLIGTATIFLVIFFLGTMMEILVHAKRPASNNANETPINATLRNELGDKITPDFLGVGPDHTYVDGEEGVVAHFGGAGNIRIFTDQDAKKNNPSPRHFVVTLGVSVPHANFMRIIDATDRDPPPPPEVPESFRDMTAVGQALEGSVAVNWDSEDLDADLKLRCGENPNITNAEDMTDTDRVLVTCVDSQNGQCTAWNVEPMLNMYGEFVCRLFEYQGRVKGQHNWQPLGDFNVPFGFSVIRQ